jgi:flagellar motor switch protein FliN/FliY
MNNNFLSQDEIDALLSKKADVNDEDLTNEKKDIIGEVGNISMSTAATTLSSILGRQVLITTPRVSSALFAQIIQECKKPKVVSTVRFKNGLKGDNLLMMDVSDANIIADLMMGGDGSGGSESNKILSELELSAVGEAMNQMIGSASTAMATMLGKQVDILPPNVELWDSNYTIDCNNFEYEKTICKISFDLTVEGLIQSEIMQIYTMEAVEEIVNIMLNGEESQEENEVTVESQPEVQVRENPKEDRRAEKVSVQKPIFPDLNPPQVERTTPRNLDLIMDVPLEFSVVLGKTKKTIKDVLSFSNGSVVELNKLAVDPLEIYVNGKLIAQGEVVVINENFGIRITNILSQEQRVQNLK